MVLALIVESPVAPANWTIRYSKERLTCFYYTTIQKTLVTAFGAWIFLVSCPAQIDWEWMEWAQWEHHHHHPQHYYASYQTRYSELFGWC